MRQRRGANWFAGIMSSISKLAGLEKIYTNSCMRPTVVTDLLTAGYDTRQVKEFTGHKSEGMVQHYSRKLERMKDDEKAKASELTTSSGRSKLRREQGASKSNKVKLNILTFQNSVPLKFLSAPPKSSKYTDIKTLLHALNDI